MIRLGAVSYLNARPLVHGLDQQTDRFSLRFDVPSRCASLLHDGTVDLGLIPSIEVTQRPDYHVVP
ncbi:MAG: MqnA/MqnD/SBP family protein, partial [Acidobacteriota bacterium]|nr:MqnA/MqnD/SBP family protein [Acidobacteriota bacterium]